MVLADTHIPTRVVDGSSLADEDISSLYGFLSELLDTETLALRLTTVLRTGLTFFMCHNTFLLIKLSDSIDADLGKLLAMAVQLLESFTTDFLENKYFLCLGLVIEDGSLDNSTLNVRSTDLDCTLILNEEHLVEFYFSTLASLESVDKDFHSSFNFKLLACNVYDCVHSIKLIKSFRPQAVASRAALVHSLTVISKFELQS